MSLPPTGRSEAEMAAEGTLPLVRHAACAVAAASAVYATTLALSGGSHDVAEDITDFVHSAAAVRASSQSALSFERTRSKHAIALRPADDAAARVLREDAAAALPARARRPALLRTRGAVGVFGRVRPLVRPARRLGRRRGHSCQHVVSVWSLYSRCQIQYICRIIHCCGWWSVGPLDLGRGSTDRNTTTDKRGARLHIYGRLEGQPARRLR